MRLYSRVCWCIWRNLMSKGQTLQDPFLNALRKDRIPVSIFLVNGIKLQGQIESFDQYVVLLKNTVSQMVYKHAISTIVPARNPRTASESGVAGASLTSPNTNAYPMSGGFDRQSSNFGAGAFNNTNNTANTGFNSSFGNTRSGFTQNSPNQNFDRNNQVFGKSYPNQGYDRQTPDNFRQSGFGGFDRSSYEERGFDGKTFDKKGFDNFDNNAFDNKGFDPNSAKFKNNYEE